MGKAALLALGAFLVAEAYTMSGQLSTDSATASRTAEQQSEILARQVALSGFERVKQAAAQGTMPSSTSGTADGGTYTVAVTGAGSDRSVVVHGYDATRRGDYVINARFVQEMVASREVQADPAPFMQFSMIAEENLEIKGNVAAEPFLALASAGGDLSEYNANMHSNGTLSVSGNAASIKGFGTSVNPLSSQTLRHANVFQPVYNPTRVATLRQAPRVDMRLDDFDTEKIVAHMGGADQTSAGSVTLSAQTYDFTASGKGSPASPYVWHIKGDLTVQGPAALKGYVMFLVDGTINLRGNARAVTLDASDKITESRIAWYGKTGISLRGNSQIWGQLYTPGQLGFEAGGTPQIYGTVAGRSINLHGTPNLHLLSASPALTTFWNTPEMRIRLASYSEGFVN